MMIDFSYGVGKLKERRDGQYFFWAKLGSFPRALLISAAYASVRYGIFQMTCASYWFFLRF